MKRSQGISIDVNWYVWKKQCRTNCWFFTKGMSILIFNMTTLSATCCFGGQNILGSTELAVSPIPPYLPDNAPSDYHLFRAITHGQAEQHFTSHEECKKRSNSWIASKVRGFYASGIRMLPKKWAKVVSSEGQNVAKTLYYINKNFTN